MLRPGAAGRVRDGQEWRGEERFGRQGQPRTDTQRRVKSRPGVAGRAGSGNARLGRVRHGRFGTARWGEVRYVSERYGMASNKKEE